MCRPYRGFQHLSQMIPGLYSPAEVVATLRAGDTMPLSKDVKSLGFGEPSYESLQIEKLKILVRTSMSLGTASAALQLWIRVNEVSRWP